MSTVADAGLAEGVLVEVRGRLAVWLEEEARHGRYPGDDDQQAYCEALLEDALAADASRRLAIGDTALTRGEEQAVRVHVRDGVFGAGALQPFLDGAWSDVLVSSELMVLVDAVSGLKEYRPSPLPLRCRGGGVGAVAGATPRPSPPFRHRPPQDQPASA